MEPEPSHGSAVNPTNYNRTNSCALPFASNTSGSLIGEAQVLTTGGQKAVDDLKSQLRRMEAFFAGSSYSTYVMSPDWSRLRQLSGAGFRANEHEGDPNWLLKYVDPAEQPAVQKRILESIATGNVFELEHKVERADGSPGWTRTRAVPVRGENGEIEEWFGVASDVTEEHTRAKQLAELASIVASSDDAIISKDLNGIITSWNAAAQRFFGYRAEEIVGKSILTLIPEHLQSDEPKILAEIRAGRKIEHFETFRKKKNGDVVEVSLTISPVKNAHGDVIGASKILRDITERRHTEKNLKEQQERLRQVEKLAAAGQLAASLAHEINNPLSSVTNALFLLETHPNLDEAARSFVAMADSELKRVSHIVKQSLSYYRVDSKPGLVDLTRIIRDSAMIYGEKMLRNKISFEPHVDTVVNVVGFASELRQVVDNLFLNAIQAMPHGGRLIVYLHESHSWAIRRRYRKGVRLTVADTGCGIPRENLARLFQPFFTTKADKGTGLGLWVLQGIVSKHEGIIRIRSCTEPNHSGTVVSVFLPTSAEI